METEEGGLRITHNAGFFSCCSIRLESIIRYYQEHHHRLPTSVDSSRQFEWYKPFSNMDGDVTFEYFRHYNETIHNNHNNNVSSMDFPTASFAHDHEDQFMDYRNVPYHHIRPFIETYFALAPGILELVSMIRTKYHLRPHEVCAVFYRGNDKAGETTLCSHDDMFAQVRPLVEAHPSCRILLQSDETEFLQQGIATFPNHAFFFRDEIRHIYRNRHATVDSLSRDMNVSFSKYFLAIVYIMAQCRWIVCTSGNCSLFTMYYRGHAQNVRQYLVDEWLGELDLVPSP